MYKQLFLINVKIFGKNKAWTLLNKFIERLTTVTRNNFINNKLHFLKTQLSQHRFLK